jgi:hypothetical protein
MAQKIKPRVHDDNVAPVTGIGGAIASAMAAVRLAEQAFAEASAELNARRQELRVLHPPVRTTHPHEVEALIDQEDDHAFQVARLGRIIKHLEGITAARQAEVLALRADGEHLRQRLRELEAVTIPAAERERVEAEARLARERREAVDRVRLAEQQLAGAPARLGRLAAERRALTGEG